MARSLRTGIFTDLDFAKAATGQKITGEDLGFTVSDVLSSLSNMNGVAIANEMIQCAAGGDPNFKRGAEEAMAIFLYSFEMHGNEAGDPLVIAATEMVDGGMSSEMSLGIGNGRRSDIASAMIYHSYMREVRERLAP